ncbi:MAG TPA: efflux RND transporter permease subunit [Vicinamibacterales bacterium]|nr:efflux RND transporter permease subunit [Vicinamibacterales bacterium]
MIDALIRWSLGHRSIVVALAAAFLLWGGWTATRIPLDVLPDLTAPTVTILAEGPGMDPLEIESLVTFPIESSLNGAAGVRRVRSATAVGVAVVWVEFDWGYDINRARQTVAEKLTLVSGSLPPDVEPPFLAPVSSIMGEVLFIDLESDRHSSLELRTAAETVVRRRLLAVPGVSQVIATGGEQKQYEVVLDPARLAVQQVTLQEVERALVAANQNATAGFQASQGQEYLVRGVGRLADVNAIANVSIKTVDDVPVLVRDVGSVREGAAIKRGEGSHNARPAVILGIQKQPAVNTLELTRRIETTLEDIQRALPEGMQIHRDLFRQADFIEQSLDNLFTAFLEGAALVILVVVLFLMNMRAALITLLALPLSLVAAVLAMDRFGLTINSMSLGGLAIAIGELVDDAIIDVENVVRRLRENASLPDAERQPVLSVVYRASTEIRQSVVFATVIVALVFLPLFMLSSVEGRLLRPLGFGYVVALTASLVVALTVTPVLCSWLLPASRLIQAGAEPRFPQRLKAAYERWLGHAFGRWRTVLAAAAVLLMAALAGIVAAGRSFLPEFNEGALTVSAVTIPGTSLADSNALGNALERLMLGVPEVTSTARRTGRAELDEHVQGVESAEVDVRLQMKDRSREEVLEDLRQKVSLLPGTNVTIGQPISHRIDHMLSGTRANIAVKIFGDDLPTLRQLAGQVQAQMAQVEGVVDLAAEAQTDIPTLKVRVDPAAAARHGLESGTVAEALQTARVGHAVGRILEGQIAVPLVVRYALEDAGTLDAIGSTPIQTPDRRQIPLASVAQLQEDRGPNFVMRENVQRRIVVQSNVSGRDLRSVVNDIQDRVGRHVRLPQGYHVEYGGQFESEAQASRQLLWLSLGVVAAIFFILSAAFGSARDGVLIMLNLPLALIGGVVGVYLAGGVLSVASIVGFITLFGIATRNGIMLVSHIRHLQEAEGVRDFRTAVMRGATERLIPILMTALAAGLALVPIALSVGEPGSEIQAPMAMVILFGLASSTALNMIVVPVLYSRFGRPVTMGAVP